jgi:dynein heavy chain, axonemal
LQYVAAMGHPGAGKNDIPNRLKRNFFTFNLVLPSITSINDIYGQMLRGRFPTSGGEFDSATLAVAGKLTSATIQLWRAMKARMLPTPAKFHYIFNMRDLSRVFQVRHSVQCLLVLQHIVIYSCAVRCAALVQLPR